MGFSKSKLWYGLRKSENAGMGFSVKTLVWGSGSLSRWYGLQKLEAVVWALKFKHWYGLLEV